MSSSHDRTPETRSAQLIHDRQERLEEVLDLFSQQAAEVQLTAAMKREIATHVINYHRVLSQYRDENVLNDGDIPDITPIRQRLGETTTVVSASAGRGRGSRPQQVPAIDELGFWELEGIARDLEAAAKKLGFWEPAKEQTPNDDPDADDLRALLEARGQQQAVENLPGSQEDSA